MHTYDASFTGFYCLDVLGVPVTNIAPGGGCIFIDDIHITTAGTCGGSVIDAAKLGLKCVAVGAVGNDEKADFMINQLKSFGVDTSTMQMHESVPTSSSILTIRPDGSRPVLHVRGVSEEFYLSDEAIKKALDAKVVHFGGTGLLPKVDGKPTMEFMRAAKALGRITTLDLISVTKETLDVVKPVLPFVDFFMPSIDEAGIMSGSMDPEYCADFYLGLGAKNCAISLGADGSLIASQDGTRFYVPAHDVRVLDTCGCGDAYSAGFVVGLAKDMDIEDCARFATACGALVATGLGSDAGIIDFDTTMKAMNSLPLRK